MCTHNALQHIYRKPSTANKPKHLTLSASTVVEGWLSVLVLLPHDLDTMQVLSQHDLLCGSGYFRGKYEAFCPTTAAWTKLCHDATEPGFQMQQLICNRTTEKQNNQCFCQTPYFNLTEMLYKGLKRRVQQPMKPINHFQLLDRKVSQSSSTATWVTDELLQKTTTESSCW